VRRAPTRQASAGGGEHACEPVRRSLCYAMFSCLFYRPPRLPRRHVSSATMRVFFPVPPPCPSMRGDVAAEALSAGWCE